MTTQLRIGTFNLENLDNVPGARPTLDERIAVMRPQLLRMRADVLCLQEVHGQETQGQPRSLLALDALLAQTPYSQYHVVHTRTANGETYDQRNLVVVSRFPVQACKQIRHDIVPRPQYRSVTAIPAEAAARDISWGRPVFYVTLDVGNGQSLHVVNLHLKSKLPSAIAGQMVD